MMIKRIVRNYISDIIDDARNEAIQQIKSGDIMQELKDEILVILKDSLPHLLAKSLADEALIAAPEWEYSSIFNDNYSWDLTVEKTPSLFAARQMFVSAVTGAEIRASSRIEPLLNEAIESKVHEHATSPEAIKKIIAGINEYQIEG
jgi:hypothetical protein